MERLKLKFQEITSKIHAFCREVKSKCKKAYHQIKLKIKMEVIKYERNHGYAQRCEWCEENIFCNDYQGSPTKKHFWEVRRCTEHQSSR